MDDFVPCLVPPPLPTEESRGLSSCSVLLDHTAYISADAVSNDTTAVGQLSNGGFIQVSFCLARPPLLSYMCVHFPGPAAVPAASFVPHGTPAVRCTKEAPKVISTHADLALLRVAHPGAQDLRYYRSLDYFVYTARSLPGNSRLSRLPHPKHATFKDNEVAIFRCSGTSRYVIAALRNTLDPKKFKLQRYDSSTGRWTSTLLLVEAPERDRVLPIPDTATELLFHQTTKVITLGGPRATIAWVDLWRGMLFCDVLDDKPVLRDVPLPKPIRINRGDFCRGCPHRYRDITVVKLTEQDIKIKYVEMGTRPGEDLPPSPQSVDDSSDYSDDSYAYSDSGDDEEYNVAPYWNANIWTLPIPVGSWKDWRREKDCKLDLTDIIVDNPRHSDLLLPLPRLSTDPENATMSLRRLLTAHPTLGLGADGDVVIYLLSKVDYMDSKGWVTAVGSRDKKLRGIAELDGRKNECFRRYYSTTDIAKYLTKATGEVGALVKARLSQKEEMREAPMMQGVSYDEAGEQMQGRMMGDSATLLIRAN